MLRIEETIGTYATDASFVLKNQLENQCFTKMTKCSGTGSNVFVKFIYTGYYRDASFFKFIYLITIISLIFIHLELFISGPKTWKVGSSN